MSEFTVAKLAEKIVAAWKAGTLTPLIPIDKEKGKVVDMRFTSLLFLLSMALNMSPTAIRETMGGESFWDYVLMNETRYEASCTVGSEERVKTTMLLICYRKLVIGNGDIPSNDIAITIAAGDDNVAGDDNAAADGAAGDVRVSPSGDASATNTKSSESSKKSSSKRKSATNDDTSLTADAAAQADDAADAAANAATTGVGSTAIATKKQKKEKTTTDSLATLANAAGEDTDALATLAITAGGMGGGSVKAKKMAKEGGKGKVQELIDMSLDSSDDEDNRKMPAAKSNTGTDDEFEVEENHDEDDQDVDDDDDGDSTSSPELPDKRPRKSVSYNYDNICSQTGHDWNEGDINDEKYFITEKPTNKRKRSTRK